MIELDLKTLEKAPNDWSEIFDYREDLAVLSEKLDKFKGKKKVILIGNGGSITSYDAYYHALGSMSASQTLWSMEPDFIEKVKKSSPQDTSIVVVVSKSGNTLGLFESLMAFSGYETICVTDPNSGTLSQVANTMNWPIIPHPKIGGRFSGGTSSAFVPSILAGLDVLEIQKGLEEGYKLKNEAYSLSKYFFDLEKKGFGEVYIPIYSEGLKNFQNLIIQLMHESVCKGDMGQTFYCALAPEAQHHTNQRFLGGKKNVIGCFIVVNEPENDLRINIPEKIKKIDYKGSALDVLNGLSFQEALKAEYEGTKKDADSLQIPNVTLTIDKITSKSIGQLVSFWHLVAFYSSLLRKVNPFDQPAVENSKNITLEIILGSK